MNTEILTLLSPITAYSVETMLKVAQYIQSNTNKHYVLVPLLQNFERLSQMKLERGMFVNPTEEPQIIRDPSYPPNPKAEKNYSRDYELFESAQQKVLFKGFEKLAMPDSVGISSLRLRITWWYNPMVAKLTIEGRGQEISDMTIGDFITEIDRYNRTASQKISIIPTESWGKEIIK